MSQDSNRLLQFWRDRSLRFWLATGMLMAVLPIFASATVGYAIYHRHIMGPLVETVTTHQTVLQPLQSLHLAHLDMSVGIVKSSNRTDSRKASEFKQHSEKIASLFDRVAAAVGHDSEKADAIRDARNQWNAVSLLAGSILSSGSSIHAPHVSTRIELFVTRVDDLVHLLEAITEDILIMNDRNQQEALDALRHSEYIAVAAFGISILFMVLGVWVISRSLVSNMDELASAAVRFAAGDRDHRVDVSIPPELANVAKAFNAMTNQIAEQEQALAKAATTDGLTGLYNRREFDRFFADEVKRSERYGTPVGFILMDIDHFKRFNDTYGHQSGDKALVAVAETVKSNVREVDRACRFGGEEIAVILPASDGKSALLTAERIRKAVAALDIRTMDDTPAGVTISLGVATCPDCGATPETLLGAADGALYDSKKQGRNRVTVATPSSADT